jgi:hypothetical protein
MSEYKERNDSYGIPPGSAEKIGDRIILNDDIKVKKEVMVIINNDEKVHVYNMLRDVENIVYEHQKQANRLEPFIVKKIGFSLPENWFVLDFMNEKDAEYLYRKIKISGNYMFGVGLSSDHDHIRYIYVPETGRYYPNC